MICSISFQKETENHSFSLAQRKRTKRDIHPTKASPQGEDASAKSQKPTTFRGFVYRGTRDEFFIGWRMEGCKPGHAMGCLSAGAWRMDRNV